MTIFNIKSNNRTHKVSSKLLLLFFIIAIIPLIAFVVFFANNFLNFLRIKNQDNYLTLMEQVAININYETTRFRKEIDELLINKDFNTILFDEQFHTALEEIQYDNKIGDAIRNTLVNVIDGDISIIQFDRKSILENTPIKSTKYSLGQYRIDIKKFMADPLYQFLLNSPQSNMVIGKMQKDVFVGYEAENKTAVLYPIHNKNNKEITKIIVILLQNNYFINLYAHLTQLHYGSLFIIDNNSNLLSINHPSLYDYYEYDEEKKCYINDATVEKDSDHSMSYEDYSKLVLDESILLNQHILNFLVDSGLETPFLQGSNTGKKSIQLMHKGIKYFAVGRIDTHTKLKFLFVIPDYHVKKAVVSFIKLIAFLLLILILIVLLTLGIIYLLFLIPLEKTYSSLEEKNLYFMNLAHEIKTPLTLIRNYFDRYIKTNPLNHDLQIIQENIHKLEKDIINMLDARKLDLGKQFYLHNDPFSLSQLLEIKQSLYEKASENKNIAIHFNIEKNCIVNADPLALDRILNNLIDNAIKYTPEQGQITVTLKKNQDKIIFSVKDNGVGIDPKAIKKLFKPYAQFLNRLGSSRGVGLGLYITYSIIKELKGSIKVQSKPNEGSTFVVTLIASKKEKDFKDNDKLHELSEVNAITYQKNNVPNLKTEIISGRNSILVLEDNKELLFLLKNELETHYNLYLASNGVEAINILDNKPHIDLILSDVMMPKMDGFEFLEYIGKNKNYNTIPFIFLTATETHEAQIKAFHQGAVDFLKKPFSIEILQARIEALIQFHLLKKELYEKDKYATLGMLLGGISHEIFNPLLGINAPLENLEVFVEDIEEEKQQEKGLKYIRQIETNVQRIENIVKSLRILYYNQQVTTQTLNIKEIIGSIKEVLIKKLADIQLDFYIDEEFSVVGNHGSASQIFMNLIANAIDSMQNKEYKGNITIKCVKEDNRQYITCSDTGCGIAPDDLADIFNVFYTTKEIGKGTGLGLYIVKDLAMQMGWKIEVESKINEGTTFTILV